MHANMAHALHVHQAPILLGIMEHSLRLIPPSTVNTLHRALGSKISYSYFRRGVPLFIQSELYGITHRNPEGHLPTNRRDKEVCVSDYLDYRWIG